MFYALLMLPMLYAATLRLRRRLMPPLFFMPYFTPFAAADMLPAAAIISPFSLFATLFSLITPPCFHADTRPVVLWRVMADIASRYGATMMPLRCHDTAAAE